MSLIGGVGAQLWIGLNAESEDAGRMGFEALGTLPPFIV
jgi:hypothetical protein